MELLLFVIMYPLRTAYVYINPVLLHVEIVPMKATLLCILLCLLLSLVEVQSQTEYPYLTFKGNNLPNHSYVHIGDVGRERFDLNNNTIQCHTDLVTCCHDYREVPRGDWFLPGSDTKLGIWNQSGDMFQSRLPQIVHLRRRNSAGGPSGIYRCVIATNAVHNDSDGSVGETAYVGVYASGEGTLHITMTCYSTLAWGRVNDCVCVCILTHKC